MRRARALLAGIVLLALSLAAALARRAARRAARVPLSPVTAGWHVGADFPERAGLTTGDEPRGEMDDMAHYAGPDFDPARVHPAVRDFYERTVDYEMTATATWHRGFRSGAALAARATSALEQLNLPGPNEPSTLALRSRFAAVRDDADPRDDVRAWVRTDADTGEAVFVALYGSHRGGRETDDDAQSAERYVNSESSDDASCSRIAERYVNVAVPLPFSNLSTALHLAHAGESAGATGVDLTTREGALSGLYLVTPLGAFALPLEQRFAVRPGGDGIAATQTMWVCGRRFLTVEYEATRAA